MNLIILSLVILFGKNLNYGTKEVNKKEVGVLEDIDLNAEPETLYQAGQIIGALKQQLKERDDAILILKIRSRIEELEIKFLSNRAANQSRREKWQIILTGTSNSVELNQFRKTIRQIPVDLFINTVCSLYSEMSNAVAHQVRFIVQYDEASIRLVLYDAGITPDDLKVRVVSAILSPIVLPP